MSRFFQRAVVFGSAVLLSVTMFSTPAFAHKEHKKHKNQQLASQQAHQPAPTGAATLSPGTSEAPAMSSQMNGMMEGMDDMDLDRSKLPFFERLYEWFGRLHPAIVHFPIAFFPAALFTAVVGRRRPAFSAPVQFLVVAGRYFRADRGCGRVACRDERRPGANSDLSPVARCGDWHCRSGTGDMGVAQALGGSGRRNDRRAHGYDNCRCSAGLPGCCGNPRNGSLDVLRRPTCNVDTKATAE